MELRITDNLPEIGDRVYPAEIRILVSVASLLSKAFSEPREGPMRLEEEVTAGASGPVRTSEHAEAG